MFSKSLAAAALLSTAACNQSAEPAPQYNPGEAGTVDHAMCLLGFAAIPLREVSTGHHLVEATINGQSGSFVLDTGANVSVIEQGQAEQFGISADGGGLAGFGQSVVPAAGGSAQQAAIDSFAIAGTEIRQGRIVLADMAQLLGSLAQIAGEDVAGLIGQDVLKEHRAIVDVARPMLYLMAEDRNPAPVPSEQCNGAEEEVAPQ